MFRAYRAHHQERQIVSIQPLVVVTLCRWPCRVLVLSEGGEGELVKRRSNGTVKLLLEYEHGKILTLRIVVDCQLKITFLPSGDHVNIRLDHLLPPKRNKCP
jgi:hypothetical protein